MSTPTAPASGSPRGALAGAGSLLLRAAHALMLLLGHVLAVPVRLYKRLLSPLLPPACRFEPSCACYAIEALERRGALVGSWLTVRRLARCQPFCRGGFDPVPPPASTPWRARAPARGCAHAESERA